MASPILEIKDLHTAFGTREGVVKAVNGVSLTLHEDAVLGVVGESGAGKTVTALSILQLLPFPGRVVGGSIRYNGMELLSLSAEQMRPIRGNEISLIFQDAAAALNPVIPIGKQVEEIILEHTRMGQRQARAMTVDLLTQMGIADARRMVNRLGRFGRPRRLASNVLYLEAAFSSGCFFPRSIQPVDCRQVLHRSPAGHATAASCPVLCRPLPRRVRSNRTRSKPPTLVGQRQFL